MRLNPTPLLQATALLAGYLAALNGATALITINRQTYPTTLNTPYAAHTCLAALTLLTLLQLKKGNTWKTAATAATAAAPAAALLAAPDIAGPTALAAAITATTATLNPNPRHRLKALAQTILLAITVINTAAAARWLLYFTAGDKPLSNPSWWPAQLELTLTAGLQPITTAANLALPIAAPLLLLAATKRKQAQNPKPSPSPKTGRHTLILAAALLLAALQNTLPYSPPVNPKGTPAGVDIPHYAQYVREMDAGASPFQLAGGSRPLYLILLYGTHKITGLPPVETAKHMPTLLLPLLTLSTYLLAQALTRDKWLAALAAFFAATGPQATVGVYSSFQADLLALTLTNLAAATAAAGKTVLLPAALLLATAAELTHPWTIAQGLAALTIYLLAAKRRKEALKFPAAIAAGIATGTLIKKIAAPGGAATTTTTATTGFLHTLLTEGLQNLAKAWSTASFVTTTVHGGLHQYTPLLLLPLHLLNPAPYTAYLAAWLATTAPLWLTDWVYMSRLAYNTPLHLAPLTRSKTIQMTAIAVALNYMLKSAAATTPPA